MKIVLVLCPSAPFYYCPHLLFTVTAPLSVFPHFPLLISCVLCPAVPLPRALSSQSFFIFWLLWSLQKMHMWRFGSTNMRGYGVFASLGLGSLPQHNILEFHLFTCKFHNSILLLFFFFSWIEFHGAYVTCGSFHYPFISQRTFVSFPVGNSCEQNSKEHGWAGTCGVGCPGVWVYAKECFVSSLCILDANSLAGKFFN